MTTGDRIKARRKALGLTQVELAEKIGVRHPTIQRYESGVIPHIPLDKIERLAAALSCERCYLLGTGETPREVAIPDSEDQAAIDISIAVSRMTVEEKAILLRFMRAMFPSAFDYLK